MRVPYANDLIVLAQGLGGPPAVGRQQRVLSGANELAAIAHSHEAAVQNVSSELPSRDHAPDAQSVDDRIAGRHLFDGARTVWRLDLCARREALVEDQRPRLPQLEDRRPGPHDVIVTDHHVGQRIGEGLQLPPPVRRAVGNLGGSY